MPTPFVCYSHLTIRETFFANYNNDNKSGELTERFLSKLISEMDLLTDVMLFQFFYSNKKFKQKITELEVEIFYCCNLNLDTCLNVNAWNRLQVQTNIFELSHSRFAFLSKLYSGKQPSIRHVQVLLPKMELHCFFGFMFREISIFLIHYPGNKIHSWHAVNQGLS